MNFDSMQKKYCSLQGRLNRKALIMRTFYLWLFSLICNLIFNVALKASGQAALVALGTALANVVNIVAAVCSITLSVRRLHDLNHSGWWQLLGVVPSVLLFVAFVFVVVGGGNLLGGASSAAGIFTGGGIVIALLAFALSLGFSIYLTFFRGTVGTNDYGPDPLAFVEEEQ